MFGAPITSPSPRQPLRLLCSRTLWVITWPQISGVAPAGSAGAAGGGVGGVELFEASLWFGAEAATGLGFVGGLSGAV